MHEKLNEVTVLFRRKAIGCPGYSLIGYGARQFQGYVVTVLWPLAWPAPMPGSFENVPEGNPTDDPKWEGILPKEVFGGKGGVYMPMDSVPTEMPVYRCFPLQEKQSVKEI